MKTIKFRAWDKLNNEFVCSSWLIGNFNYAIKTNEIAIMQFTGLLDKEGVEIYEGDILKETFGRDNNHYWLFEVRFGSFDNKMTYEDAIRGCGFYGYKEEEHLDDLSNVEDFEVIGNIYENPELVK